MPAPLSGASSPTSSAGTCHSDAHTPYLCVSNSDTDDVTCGSPASIASSASFAGSLAHGDLADAEDVYDTHSEQDDFDRTSHSSLDVSDLDEHHRAVDALSDRLQRLRYPAPQLSRMRTTPQSHHQVVSHHRDKDSTPTYSNSRLFSMPCANRMGRSRKGRLSELIAYGDDLPRSTTPPPHIQRQTAQEMPEWEIEMLPPAPTHSNVSPMDTIPQVRSPLCTCTNADGAVHTTKATPPELLALYESTNRSSNTGATYEPSSDSALSTRPRRTRSARLKNAIDDDGDTSDDTAAQNPSQKQPARTVLKRRTSRRRDKRGRQRSVRFCTSPPTQVATHNPEDYDRTACPLNNRLSPQDVEEMRELKLGIGLLESKYAMLHAQGDVDHHTEDNFQRRLSADTPAAMQSAELSPRMPSPVFRRNSEIMQDADNAQDVSRGRPTSKLGSAIAARFGLNSPPPPLPGMEHSLGTQSAPVSRGVSPMRGISPSRGASPVRAASPAPAISPQLEAVCESPVADLCDSGSEYDFVG